MTECHEMEPKTMLSKIPGSNLNFLQILTSKSVHKIDNKKIRSANSLGVPPQMTLSMLIQPP